jgi:hypothetical protein|tara:strand:- start:564 stop:902 length:339 start_codon:yes stop_codon:yes gene_type:complete
MKKITLSVAALALALSSNAQQAYFDTTQMRLATEEAQIAQEKHENLYEIVIRAEDMIDMLDQDEYDGHIQEYYTKFYNDLLEDIIRLAASIDMDSVVNEVYKYEELIVENVN